jgi:hypothetical protein
LDEPEGWGDLLDPVVYPLASGGLPPVERISEDEKVAPRSRPIGDAFDPALIALPNFTATVRHPRSERDKMAEAGKASVLYCFSFESGFPILDVTL